MVTPELPIISVIVPVYCEEAILPRFLSVIWETLESLQVTYELIIVDDGSTDNTWTLIQEHIPQFPNMRAQRFSRNFGKEAAMYAGLRLAKGQAVVILDGDLQHPPELLAEMVRVWRDLKVDVVDAVKINRGDEAAWRKLSAWIFYTIMHLLSGYNLAGYSDFKLMDRKVVDAYLQLEERNRFFRGMVAWLGFKHVELTFVVSARTGSPSRWSLFKLIALAVDASTSFSSKPLQLVILMGILFMLGAAVLAVWVMIQFITGTAIGGFTTVILLQLIIGSILMLGLGLIGIYLAKIYDEVKNRPSYVIAETIQNVSTHRDEILADTNSLS